MIPVPAIKHLLPSLADPFRTMVSQLVGIKAAADTFRYDEAQVGPVLQMIKRSEEEMTDAPPTSFAGVLAGLTYIRSELADDISTAPDYSGGENYFERLQLSILKAAISIMERQTTPVKKPSIEDDAELFAASKGYKGGYRALGRTSYDPEGVPAVGIIYDAMSPHENILVARPAKTLAELFLKIKFWFHKGDGSASWAKAVLDEVAIPEADLTDWVDKMGWNVVQNVRAILLAGAEK